MPETGLSSEGGGVAAQAASALRCRSCCTATTACVEAHSRKVLERSACSSQAGSGMAGQSLDYCKY